MRSNASLAKYGLTQEDWIDLGGGSDQCPLCLKPYSSSRLQVVEHDHKGEQLVRGVCCDPCNRWLGQRPDDPEFYARVLSWLTDPPAATLPGERRKAPGGPPPLPS